VNYLRTLPITPSMRSRASVALAVTASAIVAAGCGSSSSGGSTITVGNENKADNALIHAGETKAVATPTSGPLSTEPKVTPPSGAAPSKLESKDLIAGTGPAAKSGDKLTVNYVGILFKGGKEFDASWKRKEPFSFTLGQGQVIKGWDQGLVGMKVGGRRELVIPSELAYGKTGSPPTIPANAPLVFVIDLLSTGT
jgi:peptidylprolyl isomerase